MDSSKNTQTTQTTQTTQKKIGGNRILDNDITLLLFRKILL